ncbi:MAG TPA: flagellar biosynthesis repressor FlbT [Oceanipulchritudo sp.]|nr:flagellar biosynthesis repressor FlbT [Oceanipulchritudo sp.]
MGLKLKLKSGEKVYINGALVENRGSAAELEILNKVPLLREKDILLEQDADSPCRQVYFIVQTLYFNPSDEAKVLQLLSKLTLEIVKAAPSTATLLEKMFGEVSQRKYYSALRTVGELIRYEETLLSHAKPAQ